MYPVYRQWTRNTLLLYLHYGKQTLRRKYPSKYGDKWEWRNQWFCALCVILQFIPLPAFSVNPDRQTQIRAHTQYQSHLQSYKMWRYVPYVCYWRPSVFPCSSATNNKHEYIEWIKSVRTSSTTIYIGIKITHETWIVQFIATYVRKS